MKKRILQNILRSCGLRVAGRREICYNTVVNGRDPGRFGRKVVLCRGHMSLSVRLPDRDCKGLFVGEGGSMIKVMFVCHGNICRSVTAEYVFAEWVRRGGRKDVLSDSSATSTEAIGDDVYPAAKRILLAHGVPCPHHAARQITAREIAEFDYVLCMDERNLRYLARIAPLSSGNVHLLGEFGLGGKEIEDPWYTGNFESVFQEIETCCKGFLEFLSL